jgi:hypothetical protein
MLSCLLRPEGYETYRAGSAFNFWFLVRLDRCLTGFPHPSGANGHGKRDLEQAVSGGLIRSLRGSRLGAGRMNWILRNPPED